jgi:hypothetical protein
MDVGGNYTCTIEGVKTDVFCGGPVYRSDVSGSEQTWTVTQTGSTVTIGAWNVLLEGTVDARGNLHASRRDRECENNCSMFPFVIDVDARGGKGSLQDIRVHLYQAGNDEIDCEKTFQGTCAAK